LRSPGTVFRQPTIGGLRRDLSAEILEIKPSSRPATTREKSVFITIPQHMSDQDDAAGRGFFWEVVLHCFAFAGCGALVLGMDGLINYFDGTGQAASPALSFRRLADDPDDLAAARVSPTCRDQAFPRN
jgi:hypothetical protein